MCGLLSMPTAVQSSRASTSPSPSPAAVAMPSTSTSTSTQDDLDNNEEVKVFNAEGEDEEGAALTDKEKDGLQEEKSSLISEQEKSAPGLGFHVPGLHALTMSPYLAFPGYAAAYASGRSPFLYGSDPLTSPPPAHMSYIDKTGLRPAIYSLPHQYPYSIDHLAAWHHQAQMYHSGALRPGSPYSLPITSANISPMSRFSPSLLGNAGLNAAAAAAAAAAASLSPNSHQHHQHHQAIAAAAAAAAAANNAAPHHHNIKHEYDARTEKESHNKKKEPHIKKPLNAFMLYMKEMRPVVQAECTLKESAAINQILGRRWHSLSRDEQAKYYEKARVERQKHMQMYPHWNARDNYRFGLKKKKRKRDKTDDPASSMKKCRARFGLDKQDLWCKPCRRKKKCVRVQSYGDTNSDPRTMAGTNGTSNNNNTIKSSNGDLSNGNGDKHHMFSDGEDDEEDDDDDDGSRGSLTNGGSTSDPSVTSPAGFSSLPSLGSPCGSIASPSTPSASATISCSPSTASAFSSESAMMAASSIDWLRGFKSPYRPNPFYPYAPQPQQPLSMHDPRDSKHPLSVSQLTNSAFQQPHAFVSGPSASGSSSAAAAASAPTTADKMTLMA